MIPLKLRFSGLNSYRSAQEVDFRELAADGLFGIFGVTGAGKSTILDAMTLALFGVVNRAPRGTQGMINSREKICAVSFSFRLGQHEYCAERVFERAKGDVFSAQSKSCRLIRDDSLVLADKTELMNGAIKDLLNMDCQRFCQTVILPQGKFDQLLKLRPGERSALFEELFRFQAYGKNLSSRASQELRLAEIALQAAEDQFALLGEHSEEFISALREQVKESEAHKAEFLQQNAAATRQLQRAEFLAGQAEEREHCLQELAALEEAAEQIHKLREQLRLAENAEPLREMLQQAVLLHRRCRETAQLAEQARTESAEATARYVQAEKAAGEAETIYQKVKAASEPRMEELRLAVHDQERLFAEEKALAGAAAALAADGLADREADASRRLRDANEQLAAAEKKAALWRGRYDAALAEWEQAAAEADQLRHRQAASLLSAGLQAGQPCPVCGSCEHPSPAAPASDMATTGIEQERLAKQRWQQCAARQEEAEHALREFREKRERAAAVQQQAAQELATRQAALHTMEQAVAERRDLLRQTAGDADPQIILRQLQEKLAAAQEHVGQTAQVLQHCKAEEQEKNLAAAQTAGRAGALQTQLDTMREHLLHAAADAGFQSANEAQQYLLTAEERQRLRSAVDSHSDRRRSLLEAQQRFDAVLAGYRPQQLVEAKAEAERISCLLAAEQETSARLQVQLEKAEKDRKQAEGLTLRRAAAQRRVDVLGRLCRLLKGNAFVRYLARSTMRDLAWEASHILLSLTASRYRLELFENARDSDFIMVDLYNGGMRRPVAGLSGGETFLVSLSLALALSQRIEMNSVPLGFFFLDEGFGSLDDASLEAVLDVLERLPSDQRAVGVITHVRGVQERIPRYLEVRADPVHGSTIRLRKN